MPIYHVKKKHDYNDDDSIMPTDLALLAYAKSVTPVYWCKDCKTIWTPRCEHPKATFERLQYGVKTHHDKYKGKPCPDCISHPPKPRPYNCWYCGKLRYFYWIDCECGHNEYESKEESTQ